MAWNFTEASVLHPLLIREVKGCKSKQAQTLQGWQLETEEGSKKKKKNESVDRQRQLSLCHCGISTKLQREAAVARSHCSFATNEVSVLKPTWAFSLSAPPAQHTALQRQQEIKQLAGGEIKGPSLPCGSDKHANVVGKMLASSSLLTLGSCCMWRCYQTAHPDRDTETLPQLNTRGS